MHIHDLVPSCGMEPVPVCPHYKYEQKFGGQQASLRRAQVSRHLLVVAEGVLLNIL